MGFVIGIHRTLSTSSYEITVDFWCLHLFGRHDGSILILLRYFDKFLTIYLISAPPVLSITSTSKYILIISCFGSMSPLSGDTHP